MLEAWGLGRPFAGEAVLKVSPRRIALGESVTLALILHSRSKRAQTLVIDYAVHHVKANGGTSPKMFKGWSVTLAPGETRALEKRHPVKPITTRTCAPSARPVSADPPGTVDPRARCASNGP